MTNLRSALAENMRTRRRQLNLSQVKLAEKVGTAANYISRIESERQFPSIEMLEFIAEALEVDVLDLLSASTANLRNVELTKSILLSKIENLVVESFDGIKAQLGVADGSDFEGELPRPYSI